MAISIAAGGFDPRSAGLVTRRGVGVPDLEAPRPRSEDKARESAAVDEPGPAAAPQRSRVVSEGRVQRLGAGADTGATNRGISRYLEVQHGTPAESFGGELVGIDIYV